MKKGNFYLRTILSTVATALGLVVPASAQSTGSTEPAIEREIVKLEPLLHFVMGGADVTNEDENQTYWNQLMKYKLWATDSIILNKEIVRIAEPSGYTGTALGDIIFENGQHTLGGPIISGRDLRLSYSGTSPNIDTLMSGIVYARNLLLAGWYNAPSSAYDSLYCFSGYVDFTNGDGRATEWVNKFIENVHKSDENKRGGKVYANWGEEIDGKPGIEGLNLDGSFEDCNKMSIPKPDTHLSVPVLDQTGITWEPAVDLVSNLLNETQYIHVPPIKASDIENQHTWYDKFVERIYFDRNHGKKLYILMPSSVQNENGKTGRLTRIFLRDSIGINASANDSKIQVAYVGSDAQWNESTNTWDFDESNITVVPDTNYAGNLLFYTTSDITWPSMDSNMETDLQGTFMTTGNITVKDHFSIAGQLIAGKSIWLESHLDGEFHYVPFNAAEIKPGIFYTEGYKEDDLVWYNMEFSLTDYAITDVTFDYCFSFFDEIPDAANIAYYKAHAAVREDLADNPTNAAGEVDESDIHFMPFCKDNQKRTVVIKKGERKPTVESLSAFIKVVEDGLREGEEYMLFRISNLNGAKISGDRFDGGLVVKLKDSDNKPPHFINPEKTKLSVPENATKAIAGTIKASDEELDSYQFSITGGNAASLFEINPSTGVVSMKAGVDPFDYEAWVESGVTYGIVVEVCDVRANGISSYLYCTDAKFTISITDVNEKPYFIYTDTDKKELHIAENKQLASDTAKFDDIDLRYEGTKFRNNEVIVIGGDKDIFGVTPAGVVYTKTGAVLDYETKNSYTLTLRVRDVDTENYPDLYDDMEFTIVVTDVEDGPKFNADAYNGSVDENSAADTEVDMDAPIKATSSQKNAVITYSLLDESGSFKIDPKTGVISVAEGAILDYETKNVYEMTVVASDASGVAGQTVQTATAKVTITLNDLNEKPIFVEPTKTFTFPENAKGYEIGTLTFDDMDVATKFRNNRFELVGDVDGFDLDPETGVLTTTRKFDYETEAKTYELNVRIYDVSKKAGLEATGTITVELINVNEAPYLKEIVFSVPESEAVGTALEKPLEGDDPDILDGTATFKYYVLDGNKKVGSTKEFKLDSKTGVFTVASPLDYETTESYSIRVRIEDEDGGFSDTTVVINVIDVNEAPSVTVDTIYVSEDHPVDKVFSTVKSDTDDPDTKNPDFRNNTYEKTDKGDMFEVRPNGDVVLLKPLDYEADSLYSITVRVTDNGDETLTSTKKVIVKVKDVYEKSIVDIIRVETKDSIYLQPESLFVNVPVVDIEWTADDKKKYSTDSLVKGCNVVIKTFKDPTKNAAGADTVVICYSTSAPVVTISANGDDVSADNIYTVVEKATKNDSAIYVNDVKNDILVTVKDTASKVSKTFTVLLELDTVSVSSKEFKNIKGIADTKIARSKNPSSEIKTVPENESYIKNSYTETVNGKDVTITYYTDSKGKDVKRSVITSSGKTKEIAVIEVSYTTKINGKDVTISYFADASTGERVTLNTGLTDSESVLSADGEDVTGSYKVSYTYVDKNGNTVEVSYYLDEKGKIAKNSEGNIGYNVGYTYVNKYGNSSKKDVFIVLDQKGPVVKIESPSEDDVLTSNFVKVKWTVNGVEQDTLSVQGLENGVNTIIRVFRDKAGNESRDSVHVMVKNVKNINIAVEKPVTLVDRNLVEKYYDKKSPKKNQDYSVTFYNYKDKAESEAIVGIKGKPTEGSGDVPYPDLEGHLGPTLAVEARVPVVSAVGGLATLDDIVSNGGMVALDGVDAANSRKVTVREYVDKYCTDEFKKSLTSDYSKMNLYWTTLKVKIWVYSNTGVFVDYFTFSYDLDDPDYVNEAGLLKFYFELKPDGNGDVRTKDGRLYGTGAYLFKTEMKMTSKLRCDLPTTPEEDNASKKKNAVIKTGDELLKSFGYRRPVNK
jgi:hypothetical protein